MELVVLVEELGLVVTLELVSLLLVALLAFRSNGVGGTVRFELFNMLKKTKTKFDLQFERIYRGFQGFS